MAIDFDYATARLNLTLPVEMCVGLSTLSQRLGISISGVVQILLGDEGLEDYFAHIAANIEDYAAVLATDPVHKAKVKRATKKSLRQARSQLPRALSSLRLSVPHDNSKI